MARRFFEDWTPSGSYRTRGGAKLAARNYGMTNFRITKKAVKDKRGTQYNTKYTLWSLFRYKKVN